MAKASGGTRKSMPSANPQLKGAGNTEKQTEHPLDDGYFVSDSEKKAYIMSKGGFDSAETDVILKTISNWAGSGYKNIRRWMLGRDEKMADIVREDMKKKAATLANGTEALLIGEWSLQKNVHFLKHWILGTNGMLSLLIHGNLTMA